MIRGVHARFPGYRFVLTSPVDAHRDRVRFSWKLMPPGAPVSDEALVKGTDFGIIAADGRLQSITGYFDQLPVAQPA